MSRDRNQYDQTQRGGGRYGNLQPYDYANWGYIILYLVIMLFHIAALFLKLFCEHDHSLKKDNWA